MDLSKGLESPPHQADLQVVFKSIEYRVARTKEELAKAYYLVYKEYIKRGYTQENPSQWRLSIYNAIPQTTTFVAVIDSEVIATATVIPDSPLGLPMDEIYYSELTQLRKENKKLCEVSMLASDTELFQSGISMMLNSKKLFFIFSLFKIIFDYAKDVLKLDVICITINPKHSLTYEFLLFKNLGELKTYYAVRGAPAIGKYLDLHTAEEECRKLHKNGLYKMFFLKKTPPEKFSQKVRFSSQDLAYFFVEKTDIFKTASSSQMEYIKKCYPHFNFHEILT